VDPTQPNSPKTEKSRPNPTQAIGQPNAWTNLERRKVTHGQTDIGNESVPIQLAQCWFPGLAISNAENINTFSNKAILNGSNFIK